MTFFKSIPSSDSSPEDLFRQFKPVKIAEYKKDKCSTEIFPMKEIVFSKGNYISTKDAKWVSPPEIFETLSYDEYMDIAREHLKDRIVKDEGSKIIFKMDKAAYYDYEHIVYFEDETGDQIQGKIYITLVYDPFIKDYWNNDNVLWICDKYQSIGRNDKLKYLIRTVYEFIFQYSIIDGTDISPVSGSVLSQEEQDSYFDIKTHFDTKGFLIVPTYIEYSIPR